MKIRVLSLLTLLTLTISAFAASPEPELTKTVTDLDAALFKSFNDCDLEKFVTFFADDVEFYHDEGGITLGAKAVAESVKNNICGKVQRVLVTTDVYPMKGFGALQTGVHRFTHPGKDDVQPMGEARFTHLWQHKDGVWKITRVLSYDHRPVKK
jgi:uncharacterized protein (TIGR02246 family)